MHSSVKLLPLFLLLYSCMPGEDPVDPFPRGDRQEVFMSSGPNKTEVNFFDLEAGTVIATADPMEWDLYLGERLELNYHRFMKVSVTDLKLDVISDTVGMLFDALQDDSLQWQLEPGTHYVLDMGKNGDYQPMGFHVLRLTDLGDSVQCEHAKLGDTIRTDVYAKGSYVDLRNGSVADLPERYDLSFGKYLHYFEAEQIEYEVYGALALEMEVAITGLDFDAIDRSTIDTLRFSNRRDAIGFDWKFYNLSKGAYEIDTDRIYVLRNRDGFYYKLRFTNFYDPDGKSGHPTIEFQLI